jgi:dienelactone hydrolase
VEFAVRHKKDAIFRRTSRSFSPGASPGAKKATVDIESGGRIYPASIAAPEENGTCPAVVLIHSFNGLQPGYREMVERLAGKYFELKVYQAEPHGFMVRARQLSETFVVRDAYGEMVTFFDRTLG